MGAGARPVVRHVYRNHVLDSTHWTGFRPRDGDIVISTAYKSGTTWMQGICAALIFQSPTLPAPQDRLSPWLDGRLEPAEDKHAALEKMTHRRYIKSHLPLDGLPYHDRVKYIVVGRDGPDVFMSMWHHWNNMRPESIAGLNEAPGRIGPPFPLPPGDVRAAFDEWIEKPGFPWESDGHPFWSHLAHARSWWDYRHLPNILFVHFEDLCRDLDAEMRRVAAYLDIAVDEARWPALTRAATFAEMKANAAMTAPQATLGIWKDTAGFFHRGVGRQWVGVLSDEQIARYRKIAATRVPPELARWLQHGRRRPASS